MAGTYPPPDQILSALGIEVAWLGQGDLAGRALVDPALLGRGGRPAGVGALVPIVDLVAGARATRTARGDWLATADVWLSSRDPRRGSAGSDPSDRGEPRGAGAGPAPVAGGPEVDGRSLSLTTRLLRAGKRSTVVAVEVSAGGSPLASSSVEFSRIRREATSHDPVGPADPGAWSRLGSGPLLDRPLEEACGFRVVDAAAGVVEVDRAPFVNNSIGTLQGGVVALLADVAAAATVGPDARTVDLQFRFLDQTGDGPARTSAELVRRDAAGSVVRVEVTDASTAGLVGWAVCRVVGPA